MKGKAEKAWHGLKGRLISETYREEASFPPLKSRQAIPELPFLPPSSSNVAYDCGGTQYLCGRRPYEHDAELN